MDEITLPEFLCGLLGFARKSKGVSINKLLDKKDITYQNHWAIEKGYKVASLARMEEIRLELKMTTLEFVNLIPLYILSLQNPKPISKTKKKPPLK